MDTSPGTDHKHHQPNMSLMDTSPGKDHKHRQPNMSQAEFTFAKKDLCVLLLSLSHSWHHLHPAS